VPQVRAPQFAQFDVHLQRRIHQSGSATASGRRFDNGEF